MSASETDTLDRPPAFPEVHGYCPMGCGRTLFLGSGGHVTCSHADCPDPDRADAILTRVFREGRGDMGRAAMRLAAL